MEPTASFTKSTRAVVVLLLLSLPSWGANVCDPTAGTTCQQQAVPGSGANTAAAGLIRPATKSTYRASTATAQSGVVVAAASAAPFMCIYGSATKTVIVQRFYLSGARLTAVAYAAYVAAKYSAVPSGGTAQALTAVPLDTNSTAASVTNLNVYTAAPTAGALVGASGFPDIIEFDFRTVGSETSGIYLRGTGQGVCINFAAAPATAVTLSATAEWTEQPTTLEP